MKNKMMKMFTIGLIGLASACQMPTTSVQTPDENVPTENVESVDDIVSHILIENAYGSGLRVEHNGVDLTSIYPHGNSVINYGRNGIFEIKGDGNVFIKSNENSYNLNLNLEGKHLGIYIINPRGSIEELAKKTFKEAYENPILKTSYLEFTNNSNTGIRLLRGSEELESTNGNSIINPGARELYSFDISMDEFDESRMYVNNSSETMPIGNLRLKAGEVTPFTYEN